MLTLARWASEHRRAVVALWIVVLVGVMGLSRVVGSHYGNNFTLPGTDAQRAADLLSSRFPAQSGDSDQIVLHTPHGTLAEPAVRRRVERMLGAVARLPHVTSVTSPYAAGRRAISRDGTIGFATVAFDQRANVLPASAIKKVIATATAARSSGLQVELSGQAIEQAQQASIGYTAIVGLGAAIVVLLISFGSMLAMGLPIVTALFGLGTGLGLIGLLSQVLSMPDFSSELALMIGLGVGIDYALFIVTRYREAYRRNGGRRPRSGRRGDEHCRPGRDLRRHHGRDRVDGDVHARRQLPLRARDLVVGRRAARARRIAHPASGTAHVLRPTDRQAGRARPPSQDAPGDRSGFWTRWIATIQRRPWLAFIASAAFMLVLASPALSLRLGNTDAGNDPKGQTTRKAYDLLAQGFGKGFSGPLLVAVKLPGPADTTALTQLTSALRRRRASPPSRRRA